MRSLPGWLILLALLQGCDRAADPVEPPADSDLYIRALAPAEADSRTDTLWAIISARDSTLTVGLKAPGLRRGFSDGQWQFSREQFTTLTAALANRRGIEVLQVDKLLPAIRVRVDSVAAVRVLVQLPFVDYVEPPFLSRAGERSVTGSTSEGNSLSVAYSSSSGYGECGNAPNYGGYLDAEGNLVPNIFTGMRVPEAWTLATGAGVTIGLIDTGVDTRNPDLDHWATYNVANDGPYPEDDHGTHLAGAIGAKRNGYHVVGIAYDSNPISVRQGDGWFDINTWRTVAALDTAVSQGATVVNLSFESEDDSQLVSDRLSLYYSGYRPDGSRYDVPFVGAAGSAGEVGEYWLGVTFPARHEAVIAVGAVNYDTREVFFCSHDGPAVELSAYHGMPSTGMSEEGFANGASGNTSNSSAIVAGIAGLVRSRYPSDNNRTIRNRLRYGARDMSPSGHDWNYGWGIVNAYAAVGGFHSLEVNGDIWHLECSGSFDQTCHAYYEPDSPNCFSETYTASAKGDGPFDYAWSTGDSDKTAGVTLCPNSTATAWVEATKLSEAKSIKISLVIHVLPMGGLEDPQ